MLKIIIKKLFNWNRGKNTRDFFWRKDKLSLFQYVMIELLLQKTRAENAESVIHKFVCTYENPRDILQEKKQKLLSVIRPIGLQNQRLKSILEISKYFHENKKPNFNKDKIYGVGQYIKNAVNCFYFNKKVPILDTNTSRIISRIFKIDNNKDLRRNNDLLKVARKMLPGRNYKKFNWILLDFGSIVCKAKPKCPACPIKNYCNYYNNFAKFS